MPAWRVILVAGVLLALGVVAWQLTPPPALPPTALRLSAVPFATLPAWPGDGLAEALGAFKRSCARIASRPPTQALNAALKLTAGDFADACAAAATTAEPRGFFEAHFQPFAARGSGLLTGYYEPLLVGARAPGETVTVPLLRRPPDLVSVDLGRFRESLSGERIAGRVERGELVPYATRQEIVGRALAGRELELLYVADPVEAFFLQIQGSGRIRLAEGGEVAVGYAGQNGHPYFAIGRELIRRGVLRPQQVSQQSIRAWLKANPSEAEAVMNLNRSFVFFRELTGEGPLGAEGSALTPGRSLAVDAKFVPYGLPVYLDSTLPATALGQAAALRRLLIAQDTGGAIRDPLRGDVFFGAGAEAEALAGHMKQPARWFLLLPKAAAARLGRLD